MEGDIGEFQLGSERELYKYIIHYVVVKNRRRNKYSKATSYAVRKMISENGFSDKKIPTGFFQAPVLIFTAYQNKKRQ